MKTWLFPLWVIIDVLIALSSVAMWIAAPEFKVLNGCMSAFAIALAGFLVILRLEDFKVFVKSKYFHKVVHHTVNVILVTSILGLVNYLSNKNFREFDLTKEKRNSLTEQTLKVLEMVKSPLTMTLFSKREEWTPILPILKMYQAKSPKITIDAVDTDLRPELVKAKGITTNGTVIISYNNKESSFLIQDELSITNAILKAVRDEKTILYFVTGHQELSCEDTTPEGISVLCDKLRSQNYEVKNLNLAEVKEVPRDANAVLVLGPIAAFFPDEAKRLEDYLNHGGSMFLALAPAFKSELYDNLTNLAAPYGLKLGKDVVVDRSSTVQGGEATIPIISKYDDGHPITAGFNFRTVFPLSSSVSTIEGNDSATLLAMTTPFPGSWAETNLKGVTEGTAKFDEKLDKKGPIGLMGVGEKVGKEGNGDSRFVLLGSSSFLVNAYQAQSGNTTLFLNATSWMLNDEGIISFNRPGTEEYPVILSAQHIQLIFVVSILLVPIIFFGAGIFVYRRRRLL